MIDNQQLQQELDILQEMIENAELNKDKNELLLKVYYIAQQQLQDELATSLREV